MLSVGKITLSGIQSDPDFTSVPTLYLEVKVITLDHDKADQVFGRLMELYKANGDPYSRPTTVLPEDERFLPSNLEVGGAAEARYWFALCYYMRGTVDSVLAARLLAEVHEAEPDIFNFPHAAALSEQQLSRILVANGLPHMAATSARHWVYNAQYLIERKITDPCKLYKDVTSYEQLCGRITPLKGFQKKMVSMLTYYYDVRGLVEIADYAVPVDFHVMRIVNAHEMLIYNAPPPGGNYGTEVAQNAARELTTAYAERHQVKVKDLAAAIWLFSSAMCALSPVTAMSTETYEARSTKFSWVEPNWNLAQLRNYNASCGRCPIASTCEWAIGSPPWYRAGVLLARDRRRKDPRLTPLSLFGFDLD